MQSLKSLGRWVKQKFSRLTGSERGTRSTDDQRIRALYQLQQPDFVLAAKIRDIRYMDQVDGHVKRIHHRTSHALTKGGLTLDNPAKNTHLSALWRDFALNTGLLNRSKLASDAKGLMMEGNLPLQFVLNDSQSAVLRMVRMPTETIRVITGDDGQISQLQKSYAQYDMLTGKDSTYFARWQLELARLDPLNYDDEGEMGRPFLDASRKIWGQVQMTLDDLVIRRRERAPMRTAHVLEGADEAALAKYKRQIESEQGEITTNYILNRKGSVSSVQGDANLDQIADIGLLLDAFFSGTPAPKGLFGYADGLSRDILQDMTEGFYDELDILQDLQSWSYHRGFYLHLLLNGLNPDAFDFTVRFAERMTETNNQRADRALKLQALGASRHTVYSVAGLNPHAEELMLKDEANDPYPLPDLPKAGSGSSNVTITANNAPKGESSTHITNGVVQ